MIAGDRRFFRVQPDTHVKLLAVASSLPEAWVSKKRGNAACANFKIVRMDERSCPTQSHSFNEAIPVLERQMNLKLGDTIVEVQKGEV